MALTECNSKSALATDIFNKYRNTMQSIAYNILKDTQLAEDAVSESMIKIIKKIDIVDDVDSPRCANFVYTIVKNKSIDIYRSRK